MNNNMWIVQNQLINACQQLQNVYGLTYKELILCLGYVEGRMAQMDFTAAAIQEAAKKEEEMHHENNEDTSDRICTNQSGAECDGSVSQGS